LLWDLQVGLAEPDRAPDLTAQHRRRLDQLQQSLQCRAGITAGDLEAAREILRATCWASDVRVVASGRYPHIVMLEVVRRGSTGQPEAVTGAWPYQDRGEPDGDDTEEPVLYSGPGHHGPFG